MDFPKTLPFFIQDTKTLIKIGLCLVALSILYYPIMKPLLYDWTNNQDDSLSILAPIVSLVLIWQQSKKIERLVRSPSHIGIYLLVFGLILFLVGNLAAESFTARISILFVLSGMILYSCGWQHLRILAFAISYLIFMIPIPSILLDSITFQLQLFASQVASNWLQLLSIPVFREGNVIHLSSSSLEVAEACSGIRSLISLLGIAVILGYYTLNQYWLRVLLVFSCIPIAAFVNALRITLTGVLAHNYGVGVADGFFHSFSGYVVFIAAFIIIAFCTLLLSKISKDRC